MRVFLICLLLVLVCAVGAFYLLFTPFGPSAPSSARLVTIAPGSSVGKIARTLERNGIVRSWAAFDAWTRWQGKTLKAGVYRFDHPVPLIEVFQRLASGDVYTVALTIPEGYNIFDIAAAAGRAGVASRDVFLAAEQNDTELIRDLDPQARTLEGYLFPDTYRVTPNTPPEQVLAKMVQHFRDEARTLGLTNEAAAAGKAASSASVTARALPVSVHAVVTLASLVERETPVAADRAMIAGVFENRLAKQMPLDTDPSVIYAALLEKRYRGAIYASDLKAASPYNTYTHVGLPPGPICSPGIPSLEAAMHPAQTSFLYFVTDPEHPGHSRFAATIEEHLKNVAAYRQSQRQNQRPDQRGGNQRRGNVP